MIKGKYRSHSFMKMKPIILIPMTILLIFLCTDGIFAEDQLRQDWVEADFIFLSEVIKILKQNPLQLDQILGTKNVKEGLGFEYFYSEGGKGKGYVSIYYQLIYKKSELFSFRLEPQMPRHDQLKPAYANIYKEFFEVDNHNRIKPYYYNFTEAMRPLPGFNLNLQVPDKVGYYMTPFVGIVYGLRGGYSNSLIENRKNFLAIEKDIDAEICLMLLYGINPASRLTAYEYFRLHQEIFSDADKEKIEKRMRVVFKSPKYIKTLYGCEVNTVKSKDRVNSILGD